MLIHLVRFMDICHKSDNCILISFLPTFHSHQADSLRLRCIGRLRSLLFMDDAEVTQEETNIALRRAAGSRIAYITVLANSRTEKEPLRTLNLSSTADVLMTQSLNKPVKLGEDDKQWLLKVRL